jgi:protease I
MAKSLQGCKIAVLALDGFEQAELVEPKRALSAEGATVHVISAKPGKIQGFKHVDKGDAVEVDATFDKARWRRERRRDSPAAAGTGLREGRQSGA